MGIAGKFVVNSAMLGVGLAADAFSVSVVNGIKEPKMGSFKAFVIAGMFALFQALMPMTGWFLTNSLLNYFHTLNVFLPWISQIFLLYLGIKMILEGIHEEAEDDNSVGVTMNGLLVQSIATSIDALLVGFTIANYDFIAAIICSLIIASVTFVMCFMGVRWGKALGIKLAGKASLIGGIVLIGIAIEHFVSNIL